MISTAPRTRKPSQPDVPLMGATLLVPACVLKGRGKIEGETKASGMPRPRCGSRITERALLSNLPAQIPVSHEETELVRIYFADLISAVLKDSP